MPNWLIGECGSLFSVIALTLLVLFIALKKNFPNQLGSAITCFAAATIGAMILAFGFTGHGALTATTHWQLAVLPTSFCIDQLSRLFILLLSVILFAVGLFSSGYLKHFDKRLHFGQYWAAFFLFSLSMCGVVLSADAITFLVLWEVMSLSSAALVGSNHFHQAPQKSALIYLGSTRIASGFLCAGFLLMHHLTASWSFSSWHFDTSASNLAAFLIMLGFFIKAGIWPFHIWLPYAHPAAPATVSAVMSGFMIKVALYGLIRILVLGGLQSPYLIWLAFTLGLISAVWGIVFSLVQNDLKRLLAYSSIENVGLIVTAIALALVARHAKLPLLETLAMTAAVFHCINHGVFKSLLFVSAGAIDVAAHSRDLRLLGGIAKRMPWTTVCFFAGSFAICSLPPFNGFASKWLIYQALFKTICLSANLAEKAASLFAICALTAVGALVIAVYVKAMGVTFLGAARSKSARDAIEATPSMISSQIFLVALLLVSGIASGPLTSTISSALANTAPQHFQTISCYPISLPLAALSLVTVSALLYLYFLQPVKARQYRTWDCGYGVQSTKTQVTADSFVQPIARIFSPILKYQNLAMIAGKDRRHFPEKVTVETKIVSHLESTIYLPAIAFVTRLSKGVNKLQAGSIHLYLLYMCSTLVLLLILGTKL